MDDFRKPARSLRKKLKDPSEWTFVQKKSLVAFLFLYHKTNKLHSQKEKVYETLGIANKNDDLPISAIERALSLLEPRYTKLLIKEFIDNDRNWIKKYWSKSTYYKNMHKAIDQFIIILNL
ncbi:MG284/MPN403 family protein [Mesomycoplasma ovipneumoniae]|uniref:MG284/MPN403 family protein n=1 Tax=Mesomycoplasma ovipneumoniae TaxID=29562 RepID=UPI003080172F